MSVKKWDIVICLFLSVVLAVFTFELRNITPIARVYPLCVIIGSYAMIAIILWQSFHVKKAPNPESPDSPVGMGRKTAFHITAYCAAILVYILLINYLGYIISTVLFALFSLLFQKNRSKIVIVALPVVFALLMYYMFSKYLYVTLPAGSWIEQLL